MEGTQKKTNSKHKDTSLDNVDKLYGKIPPQDVDLERAVLGALLIQSDAIFSVMDVLKVDSFYEERHRYIFESILELGINHKPIDILTVADELRSRDKLLEVGGEAYLSQLTDRVGTSAHLEYHAKVVQQKYIQRELIRSAAEIQKLAYDDEKDVDDLINFAESEIFTISEGNIKNEVVSVGSKVGDAIALYEAAAANKNTLIGVPSGFTEIDRFTSGWQPSDLVIIAARPSMGKTAFVLSMARNMAVDAARPVVLFSLEMSALQLVNRLLSAESEIPSDRLRRGELKDYEWQQLENRAHNLESAPIFIDDTPSISIFELRAKCRRLVRTQKIQAVIIDYLQLMTAGIDLKGNREQEVSTISRNLKAIAKELNLPVIALSQMNRSVEMRSGTKRPQLSDLRESGAIEQDADMVLFIHRPEYYGITQDADGNSLAGLAEIMIEKHRNGATGSVWLRFQSELAKFSDKLVSPEIYASQMNDEYSDDQDDNNINFFDVAGDDSSQPDF